MPSDARSVWKYLLRPRDIIRSYRRANLRGDMIAGLTVAVMLLPQGIAYAQIAELPPEYGLYAGIVAAIVGALWGSSRHLQTGPTNAISLIVLSSLLATTTQGTTQFLLAAGVMTVMAGALQLIMGMARLGVLVNFVSHSVVVGFTAGAAVLIGANQLRALLGLEFEGHGHNFVATVSDVVTHLDTVHLMTAALGVGTVLFMALGRRVSAKLPTALISMVVCGLVVALLGWDGEGVSVIGALPRGLPPVVELPLFDLALLGKLSTGALAIAAIGLTEAMAISRSIANHTGQRLDANQELVGQGMANIACGFFSGYAGSGSFTRSAVNQASGAQTQMSSVFTGLFVLLALVAVGPLAATVPKAALAGVLVVIAYTMIDQGEIRSILRGPRGDAWIMIATFFGTLALPIEFAVVFGILVSFAIYIKRSSAPRVFQVVSTPDHLALEHQPDSPLCPQLAIFDIHGDLYFGAVHQVEEAILEHIEKSPSQRILLFRMHAVNQCDFSGAHCLSGIVHELRDRGGDLYMTRVHPSVLDVMKKTGLYDLVGQSHFLDETEAISFLFHRILDPAICIYECDVRVFDHCENLPKRPMPLPTAAHVAVGQEKLPKVPARELWDRIHGTDPIRVIDVREPREYRRGHVPGAELISLPNVATKPLMLDDRPIVLVCRSGRRSSRAAEIILDRFEIEAAVLDGGMIAWEAAGLLSAME